MSKADSQPGITKSVLLLIIVMGAAVLLLPGPDLYTHLHQGWLFNYMFDNHVFLAKDFSMLSGQHSLYGFGTISYAIAGIAWFTLDKHTIKVLELLFFTGIIFASFNLFKNKLILPFWYAIIFIRVLLPDSYAYLTSMFLFYMGMYIIKKFNRKRYGDLLIILAGANHPYFAVSNLATIFLKRKMLFIISLAMVPIHFVLLKYFLFTGSVGFEFDNLLDLFIMRPAILFFPFYIQLVPKGIRKLANIKTAYALVIVGTVISYPLLAFPLDLGLDGLRCYYQTDYSEIPYLTGNIRIVDGCRNWVYIFPLRGMVTTQSPYFEGQYYYNTWEDGQYLSYLKNGNTSFVVFCKDCKIRTKTLQETGELEILNKNFPVYYDLERYTVFYVENATG